MSSNELGRTRKEDRKKMVESLALIIAKQVVEEGGFTIHVLIPESEVDEKTKRAVNLCLLYKYGIEEMKSWLGEEHKCLQVFIPASFDEKRREKIRRKIEEETLPYYKEAIQLAGESIKKVLEKNGPGWITVAI